MPACVDWAVIVGEEVTSGDDPSGLSAFASPKSSTLTDPSGVRFTLAGFRSRWTMPFSCAASSASAIWRAISSASSTGTGPCAIRLRERLALDELEDEPAHAARLLEPVDVRDVRMIEGGQHLGLALEARKPVGIRGERLGKNLDRDVAAELRVLRPIDLSHPARAERREDLVRSEAGSGRQGHRVAPILSGRPRSL